VTTSYIDTTVGGDKCLYEWLIYIYSFSWCFYPKRHTVAIYVRGRTPLEQLEVKCLAQGHIGVSQWIRTRVSF